MKTKLLLSLLLVSSLINAQDVSVEKSVNGVQVGLFGVWVHNESRLSNEIALRSEVGLDAGFFGGSVFIDDGFILAPSIKIEPRWYHNLKRRQDKGKRIDGNSGNFLGLKINYQPDWFTISNISDLSVVPTLSFIPNWGIRRNIGDHFNFETGIGVGIAREFWKQVGFSKNNTEAVVNLRLRIGYQF